MVPGSAEAGVGSEPGTDRGGGHRRRTTRPTPPVRSGCRRGRAARRDPRPGGRGAGAAAAAAGCPQAGAHARGTAARDQGPARPGRGPEREAHVHPARGARAHRRATRRGRQAHAAPVRIRDPPVAQRRRHRRRVLRWPQDAGRRPPRPRRERPRPWRRGGAQRIPQRRHGPHARDHGRGGDGQGAARRRHPGDHRGPGRGGAGRRPVRGTQGRPHPRRRLGAHGPALGPPAGEAPATGGRGTGARGGARHLLRRHRRARRSDRADRRCGRAAVPAPGAVRGAQAPGPQGHPPVRPAGVRQDPHRQGGGQQPRQEGRQPVGRRQGQELLPQHQGSRAAQQVRGRDRAPDPPGVPAGPGEVRGGLARHRVLRRDGLDVPDPGSAASARTSSRRSSPSCWPRSTAWSRCATSSSSAPPTART